MQASSSRSQIVLAEDNPADVIMVRRALDQHAVHYDLHVLTDGEDLLSFVNGLDADTKLPCPDLLLLDLYLPKRDGNEVLTHLRASQRCGQIPVVVLTSSDATWDRENAAKNYATHYFQKPSSLDKFMLLGKVVKQVISGGQSC